MKQKTKEKRIKAAKIVLKCIGVAGFVGMAIMAPNALQCLDMFRKDKKRYYAQDKYRIKSTIPKLYSRGLIRFQEKGGKKFVALTDKGKQEFLKYQLQELKITRSKKWDGKWRIIIFDIKEAKRWVRDNLRKELVNLGFIKLQNSVWVCPYECEEVIVLLKSYLKTGKDILYITADRVENDRWLKKEFNLQ